MKAKEEADSSVTAIRFSVSDCHFTTSATQHCLSSERGKSAFPRMSAGAAVRMCTMLLNVEDALSKGGREGFRSEYTTGDVESRESE